MPRYSSRYYSRSRWSGWSGLSLRLVGSLVVFAVAALSGAVIGGVSIYLINDAATPPPSLGANPSPTSVVTDSEAASAAVRQETPGMKNGRPVRLVDPAFPPLSPVETKASAPAATAPATQPPAENPVSSAAIPAPPPASPPPAAAPPQSSPASAAASEPAPQDNLQTTAHDAATNDAATQAAAPETSEHTGSPRKATRKRAINVRPQPSPQQAQSAARRDFYDYYDRDSDEQRASATEPDITVRGRPARRSPSQTQQRITVRRQDNYDRDDRYRRDGEADRGAFPAQPRPAQSFFGFGRD